MPDTTQPLDYNTASQRHWLYGFNAIVLVIVSLVALSILLFICDQPFMRNYTRWDWTTNRLNSLSPASKKMLKEIDATNQDYVIISLLAPPSDQDKKNNTAVDQEQKRQQVNDLLRDYARNSTRVKIEDKGDAARDEIELMVRDRYQAELEPYKAVVEDFNKLSQQLSNFLKDESPAITAISQKAGATPEETQFGAMLGAAFSTIPEEMESVKRLSDREQSNVLPRWNRLKTEISNSLEETKVLPLFETLTSPEDVKKLPKALAEYFDGAKVKYKEMFDKLKTYNDRLTKLQALKVEDVLNGISKNSVLVLGPGAAKTISSLDLFADADPSNPESQNAPSTFKGEEAISSALYSMAKPDKIKVVFVTANEQRFLTGMMSAAAATLERANFQVLEWAPHQHQPGEPPIPQDAPPASGKGVVWIVMPPEAPNMQQMMMGMQPPNPAAMISAVREHVADGGAVMFLAEPASPMMGPGGYVFDDIVKDFGIEVQAKYTVIRLVERQNPATGELVKNPYPAIEIDHFKDHEITRQIEQLPTIFTPLRGEGNQQMGNVTVVKTSSNPPAGVTAQVLVETPLGNDYWGETEVTQDLKFDKESDYAAPVPLAAIASKGEQRVMVVGCKFFASTNILTASEVYAIGGQLRRIPTFPGNEELFRNSILWLARNENMISVSAKADAAGRIGKIENFSLRFIQTAVLFLLPVGALLIGAAVWTIRRR